VPEKNCEWYLTRESIRSDSKAMKTSNRYESGNFPDNTGRRDHENLEHRDFGEKHARSMRCSERGMWQVARVKARYNERDEPEQGNKEMERHDGKSKEGV